MSDARGDRWISFDDFVARAATAANRPKNEIRTFLREIAETRGVSVGLSVAKPGEAGKFEACRVQGPRAYAESARGVVDQNELWPLLEDEFGPLPPLEEGSRAQNYASLPGQEDGPIAKLLRLFESIGDGQELSMAVLGDEAKKVGIKFTRKELEAAHAQAIEKGFVKRQNGAPTRAKQAKRVGHNSLL
ncbi:hypothetical protein [Rhodoblastus sp.]|uniref:hypothetical protein n=1 Tax=Rhodoblastus sp. TaxID=1962975 RepID=UPI003F94BA09